MTLVTIRCAFAAALALAGAAPSTASAQADFIYARLVPGPGLQANGDSDAVDVSANGRTVVFSSAASNWVTPNTYNGDRVVAVDMDTGLVEIISSSAQDGVMRGEFPAVSGDGRYVAFLTLHSSFGPAWQVLRKDRLTGSVVLASANAAGEPPPNGTDDDTVSISADGRYVAFETAGTNFGLPSGAWPEIFVKDLQTGTIKMVSIKSDGSPSGGECNLFPHALSDDGRYVAFQCNQEVTAGAGYGQAYVRDLVTNTNEVISRVGATGATSSAASTRVAISGNGRFASFQNRGYGGLGYANGVDSTGNSGLYLRDRQTRTTLPIPRPAIMPADDYDSCNVSAVSDIGSVLLACLVDIGTPSSVSQVFVFVPGEASPEILTVNGGSQPGNHASGYSMAVNSSGLSMVFESRASNMDPDDSNGFSDIFVLVHPSVLSDVIFADGFEND